MTEPEAEQFDLSNVVVIRLRVVTPWWLDAAVFLAKRWFGWKAVITGVEPTDAQLTRLVDWWSRHIKIVVA